MSYLTHCAKALAALFLVSCGPSEAEQEALNEKVATDTLATVFVGERSIAIDPAESRINWTGTMLGVKKHHGLLRLIEGKLVVKGGEVVSGAFVADLNSIAPQDSAYAPDGSVEGTRGMLLDHLKSAEFFDVATYPTATAEIVAVSGNVAKVNFTVRGITAVERVQDILVTEQNGVIKATGVLSFDRQRYGLSWSSGSKEAVLSDLIELRLELVGKPKI